MKAKNIYPALILWLFMAIFVCRAADFPSRPTVAEMEMAVTEGTVCGAAVGERSLVGEQAFLPYYGRRHPYVVSLQQTLEGVVPQYVKKI